MRLSYTTMQHLLQEIKPQIEGAKCQTVEMCLLDTFVLEFQKKSTPIRLLISLHPHFHRFHLTKTNSSSISPTTFFKTLATFATGKSVSSCSLLNEDRILALQFSDHTQLIAELIPRRPNCYLLDSTANIIASWHPSKQNSYHPPESPQNRNPNSQETSNVDSFSIDNEYAKREQDFLFSQQKQTVLKHLQKLASRTEKLVQQRQQTLNECQEWRQLQHEGTLLQSQLYRLHKGMHEVIVDDWENNGLPKTISLNPLLAPHEQINTLFKKSKKLRLGIPHAERMLQQARQECSLKNNLLASLETISSPKELQAFCTKNNLSPSPSTQKKSKDKQTSTPKPYHTYTLTNKVNAWVGKSAKDNDKLSFQHANGSDWWLHVRDYPGSHIVVRCPKNQSLEGETLKDAAELALRFSKAKNTKAGEVSITQVKYLTRIKGIPGKVQLSKHKTFHHNLDEQRWLRLKNSKQVQ